MTNASCFVLAACFLSLFAFGAASGGPAASSSLADPVAAAKRFVECWRSGDAAGLGQAVAAVDEDERVLKDVFIKYVVAASDFDRAMSQQFGEQAVGNFAVGPIGPAAELAAVAKARADITPAGADVTLQFGDTKLLLPMVKEHGQWRMTFAGVAAYGKAKELDLAMPVDEPLRRWAEAVEVFNRATEAVLSDRHGSAREAAEAARAEVTATLLGRNAN